MVGFLITEKDRAFEMKNMLSRAFVIALLFVLVLSIEAIAAEITIPEDFFFDLTTGVPKGERQDLTFTISNELSQEPEIAEIYSVQAVQLDNAYTRFILEYTMPEGLGVFVFDPPGGRRIRMEGKEKTTSGRSILKFDLDNEKLTKTDMVNVNFNTGDKNRFFVMISTPKNLEHLDPLAMSLTDGTPVGNEYEAFFNVTNELADESDLAQIYGFRYQRLDNGNVRFTLDYSMPEGFHINVFNPNGRYVKMQGTKETVSGRNTVQFEIPNETILNANVIVVNFSAEQKSYTVSFRVDENYWLSLTEGMPISEAKTILFETENLLSKKTDKAEIHNCTMQELDNDYIRFTLEYTMPQAFSFYVFDPQGKSIKLYSHETVPAKTNNVQFDILKADVEAAGSITAKFHNNWNDQDQFNVYLYTKARIAEELTEGTPIGVERRITYNVSNELSRGANQAQIHDLSYQLLDNEYVRFTLVYTLPAGLHCHVFDPPEGMKVNLLSDKLTASGKNTLEFDISKEELASINELSLNFYTDASNRFFVFFWTDMIK